MKADHMIGNTHSKNTGAKDTLIQIGSHVNTQAGYFLFYGFFFFVYILFWYGLQNVTEPSVTLPMAYVCSKCWSRSFERFVV